MPDGARRRLKFFTLAISTGLKPLERVVGTVTAIAGGSAIWLFAQNRLLAVAVFVACGVVALFEGAYRLWDRTDLALAVAEEDERLSPPDRLKALRQEGERLREAAASDADLGTVHQQSGLGPWMETVNRVLATEAPSLAIWADQMRSVAPRSTGPPGAFKAMQISTYDWLLDRLQEIEAMLRAKEPGGHPDGKKATARWNRMAKGLRLFQENDLLRQGIAGINAMPHVGPDRTPDEIKEAMAANNREVAEFVTSLRGDEGWQQLSEEQHAEFPFTVSPDFDAGEMTDLATGGNALRIVLGSGELTRS